MKPEYKHDANFKYLILHIRSLGLEKRIMMKDLGKWGCDHEYMTSDDGRCWDCGTLLNRQDKL